MRRSRTVSFVAGAGFLAMASHAVGQGLVPSADELRQMVDKIAARTLDRPGAVGLSIAIARGDEVIYANGYGLAEVEHGVPANAETLFRAGPLTRGFTAVAIMRLVEDGQIDLDVSIDNYLPEFPLQDELVTVRHLLTQTSGIQSYTALDEWFETKALDMTSDEVLAMFKDMPFVHEPGRFFNHNNSGYFLLGLIIEETTGLSYEQYVTEEFFTPLGLVRTRFDSNSELIPNRAQGYMFLDGVVQNDEIMSVTQIRSAGAVLSNARELVEWQVALFNGTMLSAESVVRMTTPYILNDGRSAEHGFGMMIRMLGERPVYEQMGNIFGFDTSMSYYPIEDLHVAVLSNCQNISALRVAQYVAKAALGEPVPILLAKEVDGTDFSAYTGRYRIATPLAELDFQVGPDGNLFIVSSNQSTIRLLYMGGARFMYDAGGSVVNINFLIDMADPTGKAGQVEIENAGDKRTAVRFRPGRPLP